MENLKVDFLKQQPEANAGGSQDIDLQAKKQPKNFKFYTLVAFLFSCGKGIRLSKIDQININTTCFNLLDNMTFVITKVD